MSVSTYTAANTEMMVMSGQVIANNANAAFINDVTEPAFASNSFLSKSLVIQVALWFPAAFVFTGLATAFTLASVILIVMLDLRDKYWPIGVK